MILELEQSGFVRDVGEGSIPVVAVQYVLAVIRDEQIHHAIIVVVSNAHPLAPTGAHKIGLRRHIRKCPVTIVPVKVIRRLLAFRKPT